MEPVARNCESICPIAVFGQKRAQLLATIKANDTCCVNGESRSLTNLREEASRPRQHTASLSTYEATMPQIKMIVSNWYTDELGNQARIIKARD
jgi:hypothetical protein